MGASGQDLPAHGELRVLSTAALDSTAVLILIPQRNRSTEKQPEGSHRALGCLVSARCLSLSRPVPFLLFTLAISTCPASKTFHYVHPSRSVKAFLLLPDFSERPAPTRTNLETEKQFGGDTGRCGHSPDRKPDHGVVGVSLLESTI